MDPTATSREAPALPGPPSLARAAGQLAALGPQRILALGAVALMMMAFFAYIVIRAREPDYTLLFSGLDLADSQQLVRTLDDGGVPYRLSSGGDAIMVPADRALELRMRFAEEGMPVGDTMGNELLDRTSALGSSDLMTNVNLRRALEGELARTIATLRAVRGARVHLVVPRREPFQRDAAKPSASIALALRGGARLDQRQIDGIKHLVSAAVPGLEPASVALVDDAGRLLGRSGDDGEEGGDLDDRRAALEARLKTRIVQLLERSVGPGRVDAEVAADVDYDTVATTSEIFDPASQVARSTQTTEEDDLRTERRSEENVSVANNLPTERDAAAPSPTNEERTKRSEETVNYEISRTVTNQTRRGGTVRRLSIAVQVDGTTVQNQDGTSTWQPRDEAELRQLASLVRSAAGIDEKRGDVVEIVSRPFVTSPALDEEGSPLLTPEDWWRVANLGTLVLVTALVLAFGVRPLLRRALPRPDDADPKVPTAVVSGADGQPLLVHGATGATVGLDAAGNPIVVREPVALERGATLAIAQSGGPGAQLMVDLQNVQGGVQASLVEDVARIVQGRPDDAVRIVRSWLQTEP